MEIEEYLWIYSLRKKENWKMRRLLALLAFGVGLSLVGYVSAEPVATDTKMEKPLIKCSSCGAEFTSSAGIVDHVKSHPGHAAWKPEDENLLVRCTSCGVEFTSRVGVVDVYRPDPNKKTSDKPLIICSSCNSYEPKF
jgi:hypothetical protein